jgi:hypothetical protein
MDLSIWKTLGSHREGGGCQSVEALLFRQRDRRNIHCGEPMARRQQHVLNSPDLPLNSVRGLGREDNPRLRPRGGRGHRLGEILVKPVWLVDKRVMGVIRMTVSGIPRPLGDDAGERKDVSRKGHVLWVNGVNGHHINVGVPEASPRSPIGIGSGRREGVQRHIDCILHPLRFRVQQDMAPQLGILILWVKGGASRPLNSIRVLGHSP